ncbi:RacP protein [Streptomyces boninensis]|uniref:RacP protein n=1 Tax=Streptomyces boninensis TaxID=2039455 RepID=UPI003B20C396
METAPVGLKKPRLMVVTELTPSQIVRGLAAYHELAGEKGWPPLRWTFANGYHFCQDPDDLREWEQDWAEVKYTQVSSFISSVLVPHERLFPKSRWVGHLRAQLLALQSTLDVIANPEFQ